MENLTGDSVKVWVFFTDKPTDGKSVYEAAQQSLSQRALTRRQKDDIPLNIGDVPISDRYVVQIEALGCRTLRKSKWLNAASFIALPEAIRLASELLFVKEIRPVKVQMEASVLAGGGIPMLLEKIVYL